MGADSARHVVAASIFAEYRLAHWTVACVFFLPAVWFTFFVSLSIHVFLSQSSLCKSVKQCNDVVLVALEFFPVHALLVNSLRKVHLALRVNTNGFNCSTDSLLHYTLDVLFVAVRTCEMPTISDSDQSYFIKLIVATRTSERFVLVLILIIELDLKCSFNVIALWFTSFDRRLSVKVILEKYSARQIVTLNADASNHWDFMLYRL